MDEFGLDSLLSQNRIGLVHEIQVPVHDTAFMLAKSSASWFSLPKSRALWYAFQGCQKK